jgi:dipeptidyl aminopeptidase/acylaminoacyl peptidase
VQAVDPVTGQVHELPSILGHTGDGDLVATSADGVQVAIDNGGSPEVFDLYGSRATFVGMSGGWQAAAVWTRHSVLVARFDANVYLIVAEAANGVLLSQRTYPTDLPLVTGTSNILPSWSPDGTRLAFSAGDTANHRDLYVIDADGTNARLLYPGTAGEEVGQVAWSPDGTRIAFVDGTGPQTRLRTIDPNGSNLSDLGSIGDGIEDKHVGAAIAWSPDSRSIAFLGKDLQTAGWGLYVRDPTGDVRLLPVTGVTGFTMGWAHSS